MATASEIAAKHAEFQTAVAELEAANTGYQNSIAPYLAAKQTLVDAIAKVDALDDELESLTKDYEPQAAPQPQ